MHSLRRFAFFVPLWLGATIEGSPLSNSLNVGTNATTGHFTTLQRYTDWQLSTEGSPRKVNIKFPVPCIDPNRELFQVNIIQVTVISSNAHQTREWCTPRDHFHPGKVVKGKREEDSCGNLHVNTGCTEYCEKSINAVLGREQPILDSDCLGGSSCTLEKGKTTETSSSWSVNAGFQGGTFSQIFAVANVGGSYTKGSSVSYSNTIDRPKPDSYTADCGYWTFVPFMAEYEHTTIRRTLTNA